MHHFLVIRNYEKDASNCAQNAVRMRMSCFYMICMLTHHSAHYIREYTHQSFAHIHALYFCMREHTNVFLNKSCVHMQENHRIQSRSWKVNDGSDERSKVEICIFSRSVRMSNSMIAIEYRAL
jgi:hypothetical protein